MQIKHLFSILIVAVSLSCCNEDIQGPGPRDSQFSEKTMAKALSVSSSRLKFTSQGFRDAVAADISGTQRLLDYIHTLPDFVSRKEARISSNGSRSCNCTVDDDFVNEIVDEWYMFEVDEWVVKVDGCAEKFYALDVVGLSAGEYEEQVNNLKNCNYSPGQPHLYEFSFDDELYDKLISRRAEINHDPIPEEFCGDDACSDREEVSWEYSYHDNPPVGPPLNIDVPRVYLRYNRGVLKGTIDLLIEKNITAANYWRWYIEYADCNFREKCGDPHSHSAESVSFDPNGNTPTKTESTREYYTIRQYDGKRLKAGEGNFKVRLYCYEPADLFNSSWVEILF